MPRSDSIVMVNVNLTKLPEPDPLRYGILLNKTLAEVNEFHVSYPGCMALVFFTGTVEEVSDFTNCGYETLPIYVGNESHTDLAIKAWVEAFLRGPIEFECILDERT